MVLYSTFSKKGLKKCGEKFSKDMYRTIRRSVVTIHTPIHTLRSQDAKLQLLSNLQLLSRILTRTTGPQSGSILHLEKYNDMPKIYNGEDVFKMNLLVKDLLKKSSGVPKMGLELFLDSHQQRITTVGVVTSLQLCLGMIKYGASRETVRQIEAGMVRAMEIIDSNKTMANLRSNMPVVEEALAISHDVRVEKGDLTRDTIDVIEGLHMPYVGYREPQLGNSLKLATEYEYFQMDNCIVMIYDATIAQANKLLPTMSYAKKLNKNLVVVAPDVIGDALATIVVNNQRRAKGGMTTAILKTSDELDKFAEFSGAKVLNEFEPVASAMNKEVYGSLKSIKFNSHQTFLYNDKVAGTTKSVTIKVGGGSQFEILNRVSLVNNEVTRLREAREKGVLPGISTSLVKCIPTLQAEGHHDIVIDALRFPMELSLLNKYKSFQVGDIMARTLAAPGFNTGFDPNTEQIVDLVDANVVDTYDSISESLRSALNFFKLINSVDLALGLVMDKPKRRYETESDHTMAVENA